MPGFDGTGPRGKGPMSGKGGGFCLMSVPDDPGQARTGFAGKNGRPVQVQDDSRPGEIDNLRKRLRQLQVELDDVLSRLNRLNPGSGRGGEKRRPAENRRSRRSGTAGQEGGS